MSLFEQVSDNSPLFVMHDLTNDLAKFVYGEFAVCLDDGDSWKVSKKTRHLSYARTRSEDLNNPVGPDEVQNLRTILLISKFFVANMNDEEIGDFLGRFQPLRVLSLLHVGKLPNSTGSLKQPCYINLSESSEHRLSETVCTLHNLRIPILRWCRNLVELPTDLMNLTNLYHLDIKGTRLQQMTPQMGKLSKLQTLTDFFVGKQNGSSINEIGELKCLEGKLRTWMLQNVVGAQDASGDNLEGMRDLRKLDLRWSNDLYGSLDERVLHQLKPDMNVHCLVIVGYGGSRFPAWLIYPFLVDLEAYIAFKSLESLTFERMPQWCEWIPNVAESEEKASPRLQVLCISEGPKLKKTLPSHLPSLKELTITKCSQFVLSLPRPTTINKMSLKGSLNDHPHMVKLETLTPGGHSLIVQSCYSLDSLLKEMEQLGYFHHMRVSKKTRHLSYARTRSEDLNNPVGPDEVQNLRTILLISKFFVANMNDEEIGDFLGRFQPLRVLSLLHVGKLPNSTGSLKQPCYINLSESSEHRLSETVCTLHNLRIPILRWCRNLVELPTDLMNLTNLYHLDIKGTKLQQMTPQMGKLSKLQTLTDFFVGKQNGSSINEIGELKCLEGKLRTWMLQNVVGAQDASGDNLEGMRDLRKLDLRWSNDLYGSLDERVLHQLKPDMNWILRLSERHCSFLPPLAQLAYLKRLLIEAFDKVESVGCEFYGNCTSTSIAFKSLESLTFERMPQWCEWIPNVAESEEKASPRLQVLCISEGPKLKKTLPSHLPSLKELTITKCSQFVLSLPRPTTINKMSLKGSLNDHPHMVKLETLTPGGHSLIVQSCYSLDSLLKEMEQLGYFHHMRVSKKTRHLSYARTRSEDLNNPVGPDEVQNLRTILLISKFFVANMNDEEIGDFLGRFQPLRVLSLLHVGKLPNSTGSLKQPCYINLSESSEHRLSETVCTLHNLRIPILRWCRNLVELPTDLMNLTNLYHLDIKGTRLQQMTPQMGKLSKLQTLTDFFVGKQNGSSINEIGELKCLEGKLRTWMLQNVVGAQDASGDNLEGMRDLRKLDLRWSNDLYGSLDERVLHQLKPDMNWILRLSERHCSFLPPLAQLAYLKRLLIEAFDKVESVGCEFYGNCTSTSIAFKSLESLTFERMPQWCEWIPNVAESEEKASPRLQVLCISEGPKLKKTLPSHLPSLKELTITKCSQFVLSLPRPTTINKMSLKGSLNDHPHMVKLETLTPGGHSLIVQSCYSLDSLLKEMEQLGYFHHMRVSKKTRHLSYARTRSEDLNNPVGPDEVQNLRTILLISKFFVANMNDEEIGDFLGRFQPLRVLSLLHVGKLPNSTGSLKQPCYINLSESSEHRLSETVCTLHNLRIPILRWCRNLVELPTDLMNLTNLYHLDIKGTRLQQMTPQMGKLSKLQTLTDFFVGKQNGSSINEIGELKCLEGKLRTWMLQNVVGAQDASGDNLEGMRDLRKLDLRWSNDLYGSLDERVLHQLKPDMNWILRLSERHCSFLPPLAQLAYLKRLLIEAFDKVESVGCEFYGNCTSTSIAFKSLESLTFERMPQWCEWIPNVAESEEKASPRLQVLCISEGPKLKKTLPSHLPSLKELTITKCSQFVLSLPRPTTINKMSLKGSLNDHPHMVKLETLTPGGHSLIVQSCYSLDSLLKEMEQLGYFHHMRVSKKTRHLSYARTRSEDLNNPVGPDEVQNLRTILLISKFFVANMNDEEIGDFLGRFQPLRVLSLLHVGKLPNSTGSLKQPCYINLSESSEHRLSETVCTLHNLRIPILRWCRNLVELPTDLMNLTNLYHLDIKGTRLQQMTPQMGKLSKLQTLTDFFVGKQNGSSINEIGELKCLEGKLRTWMLQNVVGAQDASGDNLEGMRDLRKLDLRWSNDLYGSLDERVLHQLKPDMNWILRLSERHCSFLPPLAQLAYLKRLLIEAFDKVESVGCEFYGNCTSTSIAFKSLESLTFERMPQWCEWIPNVAESEEKASPRLQVLCISEGPKLKKTLPSHLPSLKELTITKCSQFVLSLPRPTTINKMSLKGSLNDHPHMVKLETLTPGGHSLIVQSCYSLDSLLKEMEQLGYFHHMRVSKKTRHLSYARTRSEDLNNPVGPDEVQNLRTILLISKFFVANMNDEEIGDFLGRFQPLRVLSLLHVGKLPNSTGSLKQPCYINLSESSEHRLSETVCTLHNLRIPILRWCRNLVELPTDLMNLTNLYHLDIKGTRLQQMTPQMGKLSKLQTLTDFFVGKQNGSSINEIGELKCLEGKLRTWMLQNVVGAQDASGDNLEGMRDLRKLDLRWSNDLYGSLDERVLHQLKPDMNWILRLSERHCSFLPPLAQLAYLKRLLIEAFDKVESVGCEFYGNCTSTSIAFKSLESLTFERMPQWCEWIPNVAESEEKASPRLQVLCISEGPKLKKTLPSHLPSLKELTITKCSQFVLSLPRPTTINKMSLKGSLNDHPHMVKLETLTPGGHSLIVQSCYSLDSLLKEMEQLGYFLTIHEFSIHEEVKLNVLDWGDDDYEDDEHDLNDSNEDEESVDANQDESSARSAESNQDDSSAQTNSYKAWQHYDQAFEMKSFVKLRELLGMKFLVEKLFARLEELDLDGFSLSSCELRGISSSTITSFTISVQEEMYQREMGKVRFNISLSHDVEIEC
ncbi:hypothetical protein POTOM_055513 [Populus tomentosa]|uniref:R13L1/DRL21-like LRR repeat region domain-containing protein n=1 Tax=Populus tomentosa TaxID=118781 RepID=A0A8X7XWV0_POPTO|nr:hypothetical protein POTOM_055513 [Populus tomentosa]